MMSVAIMGGDTEPHDFLYTVSSDPFSDIDTVGKSLIDALSRGDLAKAHELFITQQECRSTFTGDNLDSTGDKLNSTWQQIRGGFDETFKSLSLQVKDAHFVRMDMHAPVSATHGKEFGRFYRPSAVLNNIQIWATQEGSTVTLQLGEMVLVKPIKAVGHWKLTSPNIIIINRQNP
jgi:hypothetical protein